MPLCKFSEALFECIIIIIIYYYYYKLSAQQFTFLFSCLYTGVCVCVCVFAHTCIKNMGVAKSC